MAEGKREKLDQVRINISTLDRLVWKQRFDSHMNLPIGVFRQDFMRATAEGRLETVKVPQLETMYYALKLRKFTKTSSIF